MTAPYKVLTNFIKIPPSDRERCKDSRKIVRNLAPKNPIDPGMKLATISTINFVCTKSFGDKFFSFPNIFPFETFSRWQNHSNTNIPSTHPEIHTKYYLNYFEKRVHRDKGIQSFNAASLKSWKFEKIEEE